MSAATLAGIGLLLMLCSLVAAAVAVLIIVDADPGDYPPLSDIHGGWSEVDAAWEEHVTSALLAAEPTPIYDRLVCEQIERGEGWK